MYVSETSKQINIMSMDSVFNKLINGKPTLGLILC